MNFIKKLFSKKCYLLLFAVLLECSNLPWAHADKNMRALGGTPSDALFYAKQKCDSILATFYPDELECPKQTRSELLRNGRSTFKDQFTIYSRRTCRSRGTRLTSQGHEAEYSAPCVEYKRVRIYDANYKGRS